MPRLPLQKATLYAAAIVALTTCSPTLAAVALIPFAFCTTRNRAASVVASIAALFLITRADASAIQLAGIDSSLQWLQDGATKIKVAFIILAVALASLAIAWGALHFVRHRDQWVQAIEIIMGGVVAAAIIYHTDVIVGLAAAGALVP